MLFSKPAQPSHFRSYVQSKLSWESVNKALAYRPETTSHILRESGIEAVTEKALMNAMLLLAVGCWQRLMQEHQKVLCKVEEDVLLFESLAYVASSLCGSLNPDGSTHETAVEVRWALDRSLEQLTLLAASDIDDAWLSRIETYDQCAKAKDREAFLTDTFCRVVTYLENGEDFSRIRIRHEDPPNLRYVPTAIDIYHDVHKRLEHMVGLITDRTLKERDEYGA